MTIKQTGGIFGRNPTFNDVDVDGDLSVSGDSSVSGDTTTTRLSVGTSNSPPSPYSIYLRSRSDSGNLLNTLCEDLDGGVISGQVLSRTDYKTAEGTGQIVASQRVEYTNAIGGAKFVFATSSNGSVAATDRVTITDSGNLAFQSGKGIDFSATSGTGTSELFDDYEEGTWTPTFGITGGSFSSITYNAFTGGTYTKIGNVVHVSGYITTNSAVVAVDGGLTIEGLPFATGSGTGLSTRSAVTIGEALAFGTNYPTAGRFQAGASRIYVTERSSANGASTFLQASNMGNTTVDNQISFSGFYMT